VVILLESPGGVPGTDYLSFMDYIVKQVANALQADVLKEAKGR
jgi:hypothetical protein